MPILHTRQYVYIEFEVKQNGMSREGEGRRPSSYNISRMQQTVGP